MQPLVAGANGLNGIGPNPVVAGESGATSARQAATDDVSTGPLARSSEAVKYQVAGSMQIRYASRGDAAVLRKIAMRTAVIFLCGYLLYWFPFFRVDGTGHVVLAPIAYTRIFGVLQRIALGYGAAALIVHYGGRAGAISFGLSALLGYWWVMHAFGDYSLAGNAAIKLDKLVLGEAHMYHGEGVAFDPEGILSTLPAIVNVLAGYLAGRFIRDEGTNGGTIVRLLLAGTSWAVLSLGLNTVFPINKKLWTSSYVLCTVGIDLGVLAIIVYLVPQVHDRRW